MRKVFQVSVNDKLYWVWDIETKKHPEYSDASVKTWWVYYDELPDDVIPPIDSDSWHPFSDSNWFPRHCWEINIKQKTTTKVKWDEMRFSNNTVVEMRVNGKLFFSFGTSGGERGLHFAWNKAMYMMTVLSEHPFNFYNPAEENGRKIWFYGLPATIETKEKYGDPWEISICPDFEEWRKVHALATIEIARAGWMEEYLRRKSKVGDKKRDETSEMYESEYAGDLARGRLNWGSAFSDQHIDWFRK